ncbi:unnamed protein product [Darwinula stevensoni]|uniref:Uncharacterized protein n=1 Tax=Darwinula stevensoni TaxID=69355 RepID=A0A7R9FPJ2_9CRUS|nr:unnamed protein product [Darwinula stevensoni]CAG0898032.1 unnamed protein product [Darwinula stevensoni]
MSFTSDLSWKEAPGPDLTPCVRRTIERTGRLGRLFAIRWCQTQDAGLAEQLELGVSSVAGVSFVLPRSSGRHGAGSSRDIDLEARAIGLGSHDSFTSDLSWKEAPGPDLTPCVRRTIERTGRLGRLFAIRWCQTQDAGLAEQLELGVRCEFLGFSELTTGR